MHPFSYGHRGPSAGQQPWPREGGHGWPRQKVEDHMSPEEEEAGERSAALGI